MALSKEEKLLIYQKRKDGISFTQLAYEYYSNKSDLKYLVRLIDRHGSSILDAEKKFYSEDTKKYAIEKVLAGESIHSVAIELGLRSRSTLRGWLSNSEKVCYHQRQVKIRTRIMPEKLMRKKKNETLEEAKFREVYNENLYLRAENAIYKLMAADIQEEKKKNVKKPSGQKN